jgi:glycosyltransferase involved in cell wall biosynthesis
LTPPVPLTVVIPVLDEGEQIGACVDHLGWADEVIVADGGSTDGTVSSARAAGATVLERLGPTIAAQRNAAIASARNTWVFALDADERIPPELRDEIAQVISSPRHPAYRVRRQNFYLGHELSRGHWGRDWVVRLFTRERRFVERRVHEGLEPVAGTGQLCACLRHDPYRSLSHQLAKMDRYGRWAAEDLYHAGRRATLWSLAGRPAGRFLKAYLLQGACWDGRAGLVTSALGAYTTFLKYAHLWALERRS